MRDLHYENQGTNTYLVYSIKEEDSVDSMSLGMLINNKIQGLAPTLFTQMDTQKYIRFNVSAKVSVAQFFAGAVNKKCLLGVFTGIVNAMLATEDYMLDPASIIMDMEYIFTDVSTCETYLICLPIVDTEAQPIDLGIFFRNIMFNTQFDQTENCDHVAKIINYLNGTPLFSLNDFKKLLEDIQDQKAKPVVTKVNNNISSTTSDTPTKKQPPVSQTQNVHQQKSTVSPTNNAGAGMNIPPIENKQPETQSEITGPEISFFYLMQHYNKENAATYKAQKEAKKRAATTENGKVSVQPALAKKKTQTPAPADAGFGFAVPGKQSTGFSIPGPPAHAVTQTASSTTPAPQSPARQNVSPQPVYTPPQQPTLQTNQASFGETTVLGGGSIGETTVLNAVNNSQSANPCLVRLKNNERIPMNKPVFRIGKERSYVDYFIGDNTAISRAHANFITRNGEYFVVDTNSTNHTFVNGTMIQSNNEIKINDGDKIRLANEDFDFKLY